MRNLLSETEEKLQTLYPFQNPEILYQRYRIKKITVALGIILTGIAAAVLVHFSSSFTGRVSQDGKLVRNEWGQGDYTVKLEAQTRNGKNSFLLTVRERQLTLSEKEELKKELQNRIPEVIKKDNPDLAHVVSDLNLVSSLPEYPYTFTWISENAERITSTGKVNREGISDKGEEVELTAVVSGKGERYELCFPLFLLPLKFDEKELFYKKLENHLQKMEQDREALSVLTLPQSLEGETIVWKEKKEDVSPVLLILSLVAAVLTCGGMDSELAKSYKKRNRCLELGYPRFVSRLKLYLTAGLSIRSAFTALARDYALQKLPGDAYLRQQLYIVCNQFQNGISEEKIYGDFGIRCEENHYRKLAFLLTVHLKQGNQDLLNLLDQEEKGAWEERKNLARRIGEEAGIKLLAPMLLMLLVVMFMILLPAYFRF